MNIESGNGFVPDNIQKYDTFRVSRQQTKSALNEAEIDIYT